MKLMKRSILRVVVALCLVVVAAGIAAASDYTPLPGVLSPDEVDFGGKTVTLVGDRNPENPDEWSEAFKARVAEAEELFNVKIAQLPTNSPDVIMNRILAGDSVRDIISLQHRYAGYFKLVSENMLYPVGDLLPREYFESLSHTDQMVIQRLRYQGKDYSFGTAFGPVNDSMFFCQYNKTMLEREGQADPYELWKKDEWTYGAFEEMCKAVTKDTDGDGAIDQWGMIEIRVRGPYRFLPSNGVEITRVDENGKYIFNYDSPAAIEALNFLAKWRNVDAIVKAGQKFENGKVAFNPYVHLAGCRNAKAKLTDEWGIVPLPKGPSADRYYYPAFSFTSNWIPANAEDPKALIALNEFLFRPDDPIFEEKLTSLMDLAVTTREQWDVFMTAAEEWQGEGDPFDETSLWDILSTPVNNVLTGTIGAQAAMDAVRPQAQAFLDDLFGQ